ncbi:MAG: SDR family NAD(P)-dependent oxidoreductase [Opitutaceae bacterium]
MPRALSHIYATALVTGARSGLGAAFVEMLANEGVAVWGTSRDPQQLGGAVKPVALDLGDATSVDRAWRQAENESGGIDLLVNNAGAGVFAPFTHAELSTWEAHMDVLFRGPSRLCWHALRAMSARRRGCIVNVSSLAAEFPIPFMSSYNAGKAALSALSASLDLEARGWGVNVIDFRPGDFRTGFNQSMARPTNPSRVPAGCARVWRALEENIAAAPDARLAAGDLRRALAGKACGIVRTGGVFQARIAPLLARLSPQGLRTRVLRRYFGL